MDVAAALAYEKLLPDDRRYGIALCGLQISPELLGELARADYERVALDAAAVEVVWTGPLPSLGFAVRATPAAIRQLIAGASSSILLAGYMIDVGTIASLGLFAAARRGIRTEMVANAADLTEGTWQAAVSAGIGISVVRFSPNSIAKFHVKALSVDGNVAFVTSANFTRLAQRDNVELGVIVRGVPARRVDQLLRAYVQAFASSPS
jgi:phosphatidylserine/phosphatidylglycerophosphate/cardiolipin synthase-like enzyme